MKFDLSKVGIDKVADLTVTVNVMRNALKANRGLIGTMTDLEESYKKLDAIDNKNKEELAKNPKVEINDTESLGVISEILDIQSKSIDVMIDNLKSIFKLSNKQIDAFLDQEFNVAKANYQELLNQILNGNSDEVKTDSPK